MIQSQGVATLDGMILSLYSPFVGSTNDSGMLHINTIIKEFYLHNRSI